MNRGINPDLSFNGVIQKALMCMLSVLMLCLMTSTVLAADVNKVMKERGEINDLSTKALTNLYEEVPSAQRVIQNCYAYATLSNTGMKLGIFGSSHGRGVAVNNETGEKVYMRMQEMGVGLGLGVKEYDLIFVIGTETAWHSFISGDVKFAASADASATDGMTGDSIDGASIAANGIWVYQMTTKGLTLEASINGTKIYPDKELNKYDDTGKKIK
ncbi:putative lipoprotein [Anaerovibrio sp. JC8]|uniref:lipid-binding SYLF domain-containing protein n=1 Tax=Anaerovibrio sp. JC8 TaxID=1240085 RepID=UPI000A0AE650|nr:YSC84-related protein [Anaerovibrio sp. JC8]ORT99364.1 putative lipoprotein [Anaerovibrio sp. JC8]